MLFNNYTVFIQIVLFIVIYNIVRHLTNKVWIRNLVILISNVSILFTLFSEHSFIVLSVISLLVFTTGTFLQKKNSSLVLGVSLGVTLSLFILRNYPYVQEILTQAHLEFINTPILSVQKIGLSYILFRYVHFLVESYRGTIRQSNFLTFLNYIFFFPTILAGPIDQYNNFGYWIKNNRKNYWRPLFMAGVSRIFIGAVKTLVIVPIIITQATDYTNLLPEMGPLTAIICSGFLYSIYIYIDFSGYSDIAIGTAYLIGIKTPENFNNPYYSTNLSEFWKKWHISFSLFLKMYIFKPSLILFNGLFGTKNRLLVSISSYIFTFLICGLWHGDTANFAIWGIWHGVGLSINKIWLVRLKPKSIDASFWYKYASVGVTFIYVSIGWLFFNYSLTEVSEMFELL